MRRTCINGDSSQTWSETCKPPWFLLMSWNSRMLDESFQWSNNVTGCFDCITWTSEELLTGIALWIQFMGLHLMVFVSFGEFSTSEHPTLMPSDQKDGTISQFCTWLHWQPGARNFFQQTLIVTTRTCKRPPNDFMWSQLHLVSFNILQQSTGTNS